MDKQPLAANKTTTSMDQTVKTLHSGTIHPWSWGKVQKDMQQFCEPGALQRE